MQKTSSTAHDSPRLESLGLIGNCQVSALVADDGAVVWSCLPNTNVLCTFWLIAALAITGRDIEAREMLDRVLQARSPLGLLAEDFDPTTRRLWGNFPQAYSHVGLIHAAFRASPRWAEVL